MRIHWRPSDSALTHAVRLAKFGAPATTEGYRPVAPGPVFWFWWDSGGVPVDVLFESSLVRKVSVACRSGGVAVAPAGEEALE